MRVRVRLASAVTMPCSAGPYPGFSVLLRLLFVWCWFSSCWVLLRWGCWVGWGCCGCWLLCWVVCGFWWVCCEGLGGGWLLLGWGGVGGLVWGCCGVGCLVLGGVWALVGWVVCGFGWLGVGCLGFLGVALCVLVFVLCGCLLCFLLGFGGVWGGGRGPYRSLGLCAAIVSGLLSSHVSCPKMLCASYEIAQSWLYAWWVAVKSLCCLLTLLPRLGYGQNLLDDCQVI
ncbi:hypothetical protein U1Q18_038706 [Sarracenia purpurea var. burkii]